MWRSTEPSNGAARSSSLGEAAGTVQVVALVAGLALYAVASHLMMVHAAQAPWAVAVLFGPLLLAIFGAGWRRRNLLLLAASAALLALLVVVVWRGGVSDVRRLYVLQHAGMHAALGLAFGLTLRPGSTALITALGQRVHRHFTPAMRRYTRGLTLAWTLYFAAMIAISFT
ncbi:MAG: hypothetical protein M3Y32_06780, partial [Pseudomonadota bacterium]|nr:hypothetical protein [Pseudomonadota bacterium]